MERGGILCSITHVQTANSFVSALERGGIDLILSDFSVPAYDGATAAELVRTKWPTIPLILISGTLGEELAIDALKSGATDYVLKQRLARLVPAVRRAMKEVETAAEQRKLEAKFVEAQKREAIGQLSSGVAHDFNNILAVIMGYNDLLSTALETDSRLRKYTEEIRDASNRAAALTRQLLVFSRKQFASPTVMDPNQAVKGLEILLRRLMDEKIEIAIVTEQNIGRVKANSSSIGQVLLNLALNGRDAMPEGGRLRVETKGFTPAEGVKSPKISPGNYVMLVVSDTGLGMTEETNRHLFEPFFTTKPFGTGLGLATCQTIVQQSGGYIEVFSEIAKGTTFKIYLPQVEQSLLRPATGGEATPGVKQSLLTLQEGPSTPKKCTQRILVVEDDSSIRQLTTEMLIRSGYDVDSAADGAAGWEALQNRRYDLLITDNFMPKVTGIEMVKMLHASRIQLPVILAKAILPEEEFILNPWLRPSTTLLKPFRAIELLSAVQKTLSSSAPSQ